MAESGMTDDLKKDIAMRLSNLSVLDLKKYEYDDRFTEDGDDVFTVRTTPGLVRLLEANKEIEVDARVLAVDPTAGEAAIRKIRGRTDFLEAVKGNRRRKFREAFDIVGQGDGFTTGNVGDDFIPLLGGPFNKQLYLYDYLRMHGLAFHAYHHDPIAADIVKMTRDFTLGRGYRIDCRDRKALAMWRAFEKANKLSELMENFASELSIYGEQMIWWLPNNQSRIVYRLGSGQTVPMGVIPRIRLVDPSTIWEIVTYPEDMTRVLYYQQTFATQFQMYTGRDGGSSVPGSKFIVNQIPGQAMMHYKVNSVSNEKRGRSDLFSVLGYCKMLRDSVYYALIADQKNSAWAMDTEIEGSKQDMLDYITDQESIGTIPAAGSEFIHTKKIQRKYHSNQVSGNGKGSPSFEWALSMIAAGSGFPVPYFGTHLSGASTRASAIVSTEPVAKRLEMRQGVYERCLYGLWDRFFEHMGYVPQFDPEATFPEIISADRSAKLKDLAIAEAQKWISSERSATMAAKELQATNYDYAEEQAKISKQPSPQPPGGPLTAPGEVPSPSALPSSERKAITDRDRKSTRESRRRHVPPVRKTRRSK